MRVAMLSNAGPELEQRLQRFGLAQLFHPVMNSHRIGMAKPNPKVFRYARERLHWAPDQILFVDDQAGNINAAAELGFHTHRFVSTEQFASYAGSLLAPDHPVASVKMKQAGLGDSNAEGGDQDRGVRREGDNT